MVLGGLSIAAMPLVLGPVGVSLGVVAVAKNDRWGGAAGVTVSAACAVTGYYLAVYLGA